MTFYILVDGYQLPPFKEIWCAVVNKKGVHPMNPSRYENVKPLLFKSEEEANNYKKHHICRSTDPRHKVLYWTAMTIDDYLEEAVMEKLKHGDKVKHYPHQSLLQNVLKGDFSNVRFS